MHVRVEENLWKDWTDWKRQFSNSESPRIVSIIHRETYVLVQSISSVVYSSVNSFVVYATRIRVLYNNNV